MKYLTAAIIAVIFLLASCGDAATVSVSVSPASETAATHGVSSESKNETKQTDDTNARIESDGYDSAEDAATTYLEGLKHSDFKQMKRTFAIETFANNYDARLQVERMGAYLYEYFEIKYPNSSDTLKTLNIASREQAVNTDIDYQYLYFMMLTNSDNTDISEIFYQTVVTVKNALEVVDTMERIMQPSKLEDLTIVKFIPPGEVTAAYNKETIKTNIATRSKIYNADETKDIAVLFSAGGTEYLMCAEVIRYGEKWYMGHLRGALGEVLGMDKTVGGLARYSEIENQQP